MSRDVVAVWCAGRWVDTGFTQCLSALQLHDGNGPGRLLDVIGVVSSPLVAETRNTLTTAALNRGAEWVLYMDADMAFPADALDQLLAVADPEARPIVSGLYFGGKPEGPAIPHAYVEAPDTEAAFAPIHGTQGGDRPGHYSGISGRDEVAAVGAGFFIAHRDALLTMHETFAPTGLPWFANAVRDGHSIGEDMVFCMRARSLGIPIHLLYDLSLGHIKTGVVDERTHRAFLAQLDLGHTEDQINEDWGSRFHVPGKESLQLQVRRADDEAMVARVQDRVESMLAVNGSKRA
jgi:hypothetical protein